MEEQQSSPVDKMGPMMEKKMGGKMTVGEYFKFQWKYYMWLLIAAVVIGGLSLIPSLYVALAFLVWLVYLYAAFVYFWFGYKMVKERKGSLKDALMGAGILGLVHGVIAGLLSAIAQFIFFNSLTSGLGVFGVGVVGGGGFAIGGLIFTIIGVVVAAVVTSLIGYAVAGGFNQPQAGDNQRASQ